MRVVVVTGLSGAGKTTALHALEDIGFYTVDNLPPQLWGELTDELDDDASGLALGIDVRAGGFLARAEEALAELRARGSLTVLFLDADDATLVRRFNFTRRTHPLREGTLTSDIALERAELEPLRSQADLVIDTAALSARELTQSLWQRFSQEQPFVLRLVSFGYKRGVPTDVDSVLDVRGMPNPFYDEALRPRPGTDPEVQGYVFTPAALELYSLLRGLCRQLARLAEGGGRLSYAVAVGCTGGQHRSVAVAERLAFDLAETFRMQVQHRDLAQALEEHRDH